MMKPALAVERCLAAVSMLAIAVIMVLVSLDVLARYLFKAPLTFQYLLTQDYLMVIMVALALPWAERRGAFIRLTPFHRFMNEPVRRGLYTLNNLIIAAMFLAMTWFAAKRTWVDWQEHRVMFGVVDWPVWLSQVWVPIGTLALSLRLLISGAGYASGHKPVPAPVSLEDAHADEIGEAF